MYFMIITSDWKQDLVLIGKCVLSLLITSGHRKSVSQEALPNNSFSNNFGHPIGGVGYRGVEGVLMATSMKTFVSRCVDSTKEIYSSDNIVSYVYLF